MKGARAIAAIAAALALTVAAGCSSADEASPKQPGKAESTSKPVAKTPAPTKAPEPERKQPAGHVTDTPTPVEERTPPPTTFQRERVKVPSASRARLVGLEVGTDEGVEQVTFTFADTEVLPTYDVHYVETVREHSESEPIALGGNAFLEVGFEFTDPNTKGRLKVRPNLRPNQSLVKETLLVQNLGGSLRFAVGLDHRAKFRVRELSDPTRLVVEVRAE